MPTLREMGEREAVARLRALCAPVEGVALGPGDDAALLEVSAGEELVATTDAFVRDVHWVPAWMSACQVGARLGTANLSDLAAMAAQPRWALASFGLTEDTEWEWLEGCQRGLQEALAAYGAGVVGGNLARVAGEPWLAVTLLGSAVRGTSWRRTGAQPGDALAVTGSPGRAGAAARLVRSRGSLARRFPRLLQAWQEPAARVDEARALWRVGAVRAAIDVSDGLSSDLANLCEASAVGATIEEALLHVDADIEAAANELGVAALDLVLGPSDDYELLLAVDPRMWAHAAEVAESVGFKLTRVGAVRPREEGVILRDSIGGRRALAAGGWDHFRTR
jgi:thiamine-monophosphate kinase